MKKNKSLRAAAGIVVAALLTTCLIGGTFAKYTTGAKASTGARVANWGFSSDNSISFDNLFKDSYNGTVKSNDGSKIIAPGTSGSVQFSFAYDDSEGNAPEVAYSFTVAVTGDCADEIKANPDIQFRVDNGEFGTWDKMVADLKALSGESDGSKNYEPGQLPEAFTAAGERHTISWQWLFTDSPETDAQNVVDTAMGNAASLAECSLGVSILATQIQ